MAAHYDVTKSTFRANGIDGDQPRMMHAWPYRDLTHRARIRGEAVTRLLALCGKARSAKGAH